MLDEVRQKDKAGEKLSGTDEILERILNLALTDKDLKKTVDSITELEGEIDAISAARATPSSTRTWPRRSSSSSRCSARS